MIVCQYKKPWATIHSPAYLQMPCNSLPVLPQIWPYHKKVKDHPSLIILTYMVDLESPMLYTNIQAQNFLSIGEEDF